MTKILLVPGHGQGDPGASGGGYNEAATMRQLVSKIKQLIPDKVDSYNQTKDCYQQNGLASTKYQNVIEFHMDGAANLNACGGHVIIAKGFSADSLDVRLKEVIGSTIGIWTGTPSGFSMRNDLQNLNVAAQRGIAYRLLELGFITNEADRNKTIGNMESLAKALAEAISGGAVSQTKPIVTDKKVTVAAHASHWSSSSKGVKIAEWVKGKTFTYRQERPTKQSFSNCEYLLYNQEKPIGWVLSQDCVGGFGSELVAKENVPNPSSSLKIGAKVTLIKAVDYQGVPLATQGIYEVMEIKGNRVVIGKNGQVTAAVNTINLKQA
ncbi:N-acetylmuramoyl-L-alanine amidase [Vagococcus sp. BWB3-3]|uniref:N-acetylmuramoyl-L-alanine amidase n=1 Tax=Vagococcus allomyrinae TaxID=2794353 RepID=A0A940SVN3_9ENTE|nr:N-acetylmuramoyl-L-alanine amidase [Vagococcus allomyrinae]MBP1041246.1 N-acetylmuramoyl-L-alanine amidase [Vagococcus allomyrinae]